MGRDDLFDVTIDAKGITDQAKSGRCWLFAGFNIMRPAVMKKYDLGEFEFSESYLFSGTSSRRRTSSSRQSSKRATAASTTGSSRRSSRTRSPTGMVVVRDEPHRKYGVVPKRVMPETATARTRAS